MYFYWRPPVSSRYHTHVKSWNIYPKILIKSHVLIVIRNKSGYSSVETVLYLDRNILSLGKLKLTIKIMKLGNMWNEESTKYPHEKEGRTLNLTVDLNPSQRLKTRVNDPVMTRSLCVPPVCPGAWCRYPLLPPPPITDHQCCGHHRPSLSWRWAQSVKLSRPMMSPWPQW